MSSQTRMPGDQALCSVPAKGVKQEKKWKAGAHCPSGQPQIIFHLALLQFHWLGLSDLLEFLHFWRFSSWVYIETVIDRAPTQEREKKKITCDSQESCSSKSTRLMRCLPLKHSVVAKGCEMWLITALELWLTSAHCQHVRGKRRVCEAVAARPSISRAPFCSLTDDFGITACSSEQLHFYWACFRNVVLLGNMMENDRFKLGSEGCKK